MVLVEMTPEEKAAWDRMEATPYITEYDDRIIEMYNDGVRIRDMSAALGLNFDRIRRRLSELIREGSLSKREPPRPRRGDP